MNRLRLKPVTDEDKRLIFEWANEPEARRVSLNSHNIQWDEHCAWFDKKIQDDSCAFYIAVDETGGKIGIVRFDAEDSNCVISVSIDKNYRNCGYGSELIRLGSEKIFREKNVDAITAVIKQGNTASIKSFEKAGYKFLRYCKSGAGDIIEMILKREAISG